ncbi:snRNA-activating protein complex subunit 3 isoform X4 [Pectinophora gossypiella]|uniref:snRNA-activating protein complex subunit 3 isoform X4 n=1 Tax=Pectinophora gossypiella TaxID=13191 RepID=UPI00214EB490|nr:snRNA-activating protein complex subunit 3 isoform X4 [Pectinophora gossypiella]
MNTSEGSADGPSDALRDFSIQGSEDPIPSTFENVRNLALAATGIASNTSTSSNKVSPSTESVINNDERPNQGKSNCFNNKVNPSNSSSTTNTLPNQRSVVEAIINLDSEFATLENKISKITESCLSSVASLELNCINTTKQKRVRSKVPTVLDDLMLVEPGPSKRKKVDIFVEDSGPKWYDVQGTNITPAIDPTKLSEAFDSLPIYGRPNTKEELPEFQLNKIREFVGCGLSDEKFLKLQYYCSPDHLKTGTEKFTVEQVPNPGVMPDELDFQPFCNPSASTSKAGNELCVVKKFRMRVEKDVKNAYAKKLKYRGLRMLPLNSGGDHDIKPEETSVTLLEPGKDILFRVRVYRPYPYNIKDKPNRVRHSLFSRDVVLLGRQTLSELRDRIVCANDMDMRLDVSERVEDLPITTAKELFPSGFLFINNVFYVDTRPGCADLTERLWQWARHKRGLGDFPRKDMCLTSLHQLRVKLGHPEVYVHQGNCEHLFTFSEIRLLGAGDPLRPLQYPRHTALSHNQTVYCTTCAEFGAKWIITGCERVPFDPAFFCESCLKLYLYVGVNKVEDFKAYSYRGNEINMLKPQG